ncbi:MAG: inorganic phosphate transporter family protein [Candidatus Omnitrophica bacterium]|nr:inorganic phosphate transporter family protein [Candidatus Omnitrophota bacterium]
MFSIILLPLLAAMFLAINMGGSGTSAAFSSSYGANIIRKDLIPGLFGFFVLLGAIMAGKDVTATIGKGVLPESYMTLKITTIILFSISLSILFANLLKVPQSTSQSTVFALVAVAAFHGSIQMEKLVFLIIPSWFILPVISFCLTLLLGKFIYKPLKARNLVNFKELALHPVLRFSVIASSCFVAFAIGANNVANAAGPVHGLLVNQFSVTESSHLYVICMILATFIIAPCFALGSSIFGARVLETTGKQIVEFGPIGALAISSVTGSLLILASLYKGIPTALAQLNVGAILGLGVYKYGFNEIMQKSAVLKIFTVWIIAPMISFGLAWGMCVVMGHID